MCGRDVEIKREASRDYDFGKHLDGAGSVWQINICAVRIVIPTGKLPGCDFDVALVETIGGAVGKAVSRREWLCKEHQHLCE